MATSNYVDTGATYTQLRTSPDIIIDSAINRMWADTRDQAPLIALLSLMKTKSITQSKKIHWAIGTELSDTMELEDPFVADVTTPATIKIKVNGFLVEDDLLYLYDTAGDEQALVKITAKTASASTPFTYANAVTLVNKQAGVDQAGAITFAAATTTVIKVASAQQYDGEAPTPLSMKGDILYNYVQKSRKAFVMGKFERAENFLIEHSMEHLQKLKMREAAREDNNALHFNVDSEAPSATIDGAIMAGFPGIINPHSTAATYRGKIYGIAESNWDADTVAQRWEYMLKYTAELSEYGSRKRIVVGSPDSINKIMLLAQATTTIQNTDFRIPNTDIIWNLPTVDLGYLSLTFVVDRSLQGSARKLYFDGINIESSTGAALAADASKFLLFFDPEAAGVVYLNVPNMGVQTPHVVPVDLANNNTNEEREIVSAKSLYIREPRACGYFFFS